MRTDLLAEEWAVIARFLPEGWRERARTTGALQRARQVRSADVLLRLVFLYAASGLSLQQAAARARTAGLANLTDVALMKRVRRAGPWLRSLAEGVFASSAQGASLEAVPAGRRLRVVDATHVKVAGSSGTDWRLHYVLGLPSLACDFAELTDAKGGETYKRIPVQAGDVILADRGYAHREGVAHVVDHAGDVVVRLNATNFPLEDEVGARLDVGRVVRSAVGHTPQAWAVWFQAGGRRYAARLCAVQRSATAAARARENLLKAARKKGKKVSEETLEMAGYVFVLATAGLDPMSAAEILELYRARWQVELGFKRLKSLFDAGSVPSKDPEAVRSWIYAKVLAVLLIERLGEESRLFSPWGFPLGSRQPVEGVPGSVRCISFSGVASELSE